MPVFAASQRISVLSIIFLLNLLIISFQVWYHCSHKFFTGKKFMSPIPCFLQHFSITNISCFLMFSSISLFLIHSGFGGRLSFSLNNASASASILCSLNIS